MKKQSKYIIESVNDLSFDEKCNPISAMVREKWLNYMNDNIILSNGQMVTLEIPKEIKDDIFNYFLKIMQEFITNENRINDCRRILDDYIEHKDSQNNSNIYIRIIFDIIVGMDRVNKYIHKICALLVDNIKEYKKYIEWQKKIVKVKDEIYEEWNVIYNIRNKIEHPENIRTTMFRRKGIEIECPMIIIEEIKYDAMTLAENALNIVFFFYKNIIDAAFLYSKYVRAYTDTTRKIIYTV